MSTSGQVVVFDIWSKYAYFRKPYTTTTALTYNCIPRSAAEGLIGAILGISSRDLFFELEGSKIGLGILSEIRKLPFSIWHTHSDFWQTMLAHMESRSIKKQDFRSHANIELISDPYYRIYFSHQHGYQDKLECMLKNHQTVFTPYLGTSSMIANFMYIGTFDYTLERKDIAEVNSILPYSNQIPKIIIEKDKFYAIEQNIPGRLNQARELLYSYSALYNNNGKTIKIRDTEVNTFFEKSTEHDFVFLPS